MEAEPCRLGGRQPAVAHAELAEDRRDVVVDRLPGEEEPFGDLRVGQAFRDEREDLQLPRREVRRVAPRGRAWSAG